MAYKKKTPDLGTRFEPRFWEELKQTTRVAIAIKKRLRKLEKETKADSYAKKILIQRAVFLAVFVETLEVQAVEKHADFDPNKYMNLVNCLKGVLRDVGLDRQDIAETLNLEDYVKTNKRRKNRKAGCA